MPSSAPGSRHGMLELPRLRVFSTAAASRRATPPSCLPEPDVDGGLIGGASLKAEEFLAIMAARAAESGFPMLRFILIAIHLLSAPRSSALVLIQRGKGAEAGAGFGAGASGTVFGAQRRHYRVVEGHGRAGGDFHGHSLALAYTGTRESEAPKSTLEEASGPPPKPAAGAVPPLTPPPTGSAPGSAAGSAPPAAPNAAQTAAQKSAPPPAAPAPAQTPK